MSVALPDALAERVQFLRLFDVDSGGRIRDNGKFEGEMLYVPLFWDYVLEGLHTESQGGVAVLDIDEDDRRIMDSLGDMSADRLSDYEQIQRVVLGRAKAAAALRKKRKVRLYQRHDGFVGEVR